MKKRAFAFLMAVTAAASTLGAMPVMADTVTIDVGTFTNVYTPTAVDVEVDLNKTFKDATNDTATARKLADKEFTFSLQEYKVTDNDGTLTWGDKIGDAVTAQNDADGKIAFKVAYDKTGTHYYKVTEVAGSDSHIAYDNSTIEIKVDVTGSNGVLSGKVTYPEDVTFENTYTATSGSVVFTGKKAIKDESGSNRKVAAGEFTFELVDSKNEVVETATNDADGNIKFDAITFNKVGTYTYSVREQAGSVKGFTYDDSVKAIQFVVTDNNGTLEVSTATVDKKEATVQKSTTSNAKASKVTGFEEDEDTAESTTETAQSGEKTSEKK